MTGQRTLLTNTPPADPGLTRTGERAHARATEPSSLLCMPHYVSRIIPDARQERLVLERLWTQLSERHCPWTPTALCSSKRDLKAPPMDQARAPALAFSAPL